MVRINDIDKENINNIKYEEQKNENASPEIEGNYFNDTINFDRKIFGKKPMLGNTVNYSFSSSKKKEV